MTLPANLFNSYTIRVPSPDGSMFVHCHEDQKGNLCRVLINIGKTGTSVSSWADGVARMITLALKTSDLSHILDELSNITTSKFVMASGRYQIKSGIDAIFHALLMYKNMKSVSPEVRPPSLTIPSDW